MAIELMKPYQAVPSRFTFLAYFERLRGITYDDVQIPPRGVNPNISRNHVTLETMFSRRIPLKIPFVSADMATITEAKMAEVLALNGGLGIIHRALAIDEQASEVRKVKRARNFIISDPYRIQTLALAREALNLMIEKGVGTLLVRDPNDRDLFCGIITKRDLLYRSLDLERVIDCMTPKESVITIHPEPKLNEVQHIFRERHGISGLKIKKLPMIDSSGKIKGLISAKDLKKLDEHPLMNLDKNGRLLVGAAIGVVDDYLDRAGALVEAGVDVIVISIASGCSTSMKNAVELFRKNFGDFELVAGNVATSEQANYLIDWGVDGIKIGVGPGGFCTTRLMTGIGVPQVHAIVETYHGLHCIYGRKYEDIPPLIADGGINWPKDPFFALMSKASCVMMGTKLASVFETPGDSFTGDDGKRYKRHFGMASKFANMMRYEMDGLPDPISRADQKAPEGKDEKIEITCSVEDVIKLFAGELRASVSQRGVETLKEAQGGFDPLDPEYGFIILKSGAIRESYVR